MKLTGYLLLIIAILNQVKSTEVGYSCYQFLNYTYFDLSKLQQDSQDYIAQVSTSELIYWNVCSYILYDKSQKMFAEDVLDGTTKTPLTGDSLSSILLLNADDPNEGVRLELSKSSGQESFQLELHCGSSFNYKKISRNAQSKTTLISVESQYACAKLQFQQLMKIIQKYQDYIAIALILLGIMFCFGGFYFFRLTIFFCTFLAIFIISMLIGTSIASSTLQKKSTDEAILWISIVVGLSAGLLIAKFVKYGFFFLGAFFGILLGFLIYESIIQQITSNKAVFYVFIAVMGVIFGCLTLKLKKSLQILITSFIGSYILIRCISVFIGDNSFPNELLLIYYLKNKYYHFPASYYAYFAAIIVLWFIGIYSQYRLQKKTKKHSKDDSDEEKGEKVQLIDKDEE